MKFQQEMVERQLSMLSAGLVCSILLLLAQAQPSLTLRPDLETVASSFGYTLQSHPLVTEDGYILTVHRVLRGRHSTKPSGPPLLLCHGIFQSSDTLLNRMWHYGYILANNGYDVWIHNYRGNIYSRKHVRLDPKSHAFHNFTMTEMSLDLALTIDHILERTGRHQVAYLGYSMGGALFWILGSAMPQYMTKISLMVGVGVLGYPSSKTKSTFRDILFFIEKMLKLVEMPELKNYVSVIGPIIISACERWGWPGRIVCKIAVRMSDALLGGCDEECLKCLMEVGTSSFSAKALDHYLQMVKSNSMSQFDYGEETNIKQYGTKSPPEYDDTKITCPVYLISGDADNMAALEEVLELAQRLPNKPTVQIMKGYTHTNLYMNERSVTIIVQETLKILSIHYDEGPL